MSPRLVLQFLGLPQLYLDDQPVATDRRKAIALLAYLAVNDLDHAPQRYSRESLSALLWPDYEQAKAFSNLRRTLWEVHQALGEGWLIAERETVGLDAAAVIDLDVARFQNLLSQIRQQSSPERRLPFLIEATKLYRNHFLTGFSLKDAYLFNEWAYAEDEDLRQKLAGALETLSEDYCVIGEAEKAIPYARRLITLDPLNEASHRKLMEVYIQAGQHSAALKQYQTCEQILRKELGLDPQPETRALYKKIRKREAKPVPLEKQVQTSASMHNLPSQLSTFIGREKEINEVANLLGKHRLVTLAGVGGIGKTRLSLQVGQKLLNEYPQGVWFIALDSLSDPNLVPQTIASVFELRETPGRPALEILTHALREKTALLILDNCEHLLDACVRLAVTLLTNCPNLKILATSREVLNVAGEATYQMPSLSMPARDDTPLEQLTEYESVRLFSERAALALTSFTLTKENAQAVIDICRKVDGIPLAIELAAARANMLQVTEILDQLQSSFALLSTDHRMVLSRHQTMQASLDWSWGLLTEAEQKFLRQLAVFAGGWTLESAQAICDGDVFRLSNTLVKKSLIVVKQEAGRETRYRFHEMVRQYTHQKLVGSGEVETIQTRHLRYFLQLSEQAQTALRGPKQIEWLTRLEDELDNIRAALEWADKNNAVEAGLYIFGRLGRFWYYDLQEGQHWATKFIQQAESNAFPRARIKALDAQGHILEGMEQAVLARAAGEECLTFCRACGDQHGEVDALLLLGYLAGKTNVKLLQQALALSKTLGDVRRQADALLLLGWDHSDPQRARTYWEKAVALFRQAQDWGALIDALSMLGWYTMLNGDIETAQKLFDEALPLSRQFKNRVSPDFALMSYGRIALMRGDFEQARAFLQEGITRLEASGSKQPYNWFRTYLGQVALREGNVTESRQIFSESAQDFQKNNNVSGVVFALEGLASLYVATGKPKQAAQLIGWADATRKEIGDTRFPLEQADVDRDMAACLAKMGETVFSDAYDEGKTMTLDDVVMYALAGG